MSEINLVNPHGGKLVNRFASESEISKLQKEAATLKIVNIPRKVECDLEMIGLGAFSPLEGFVSQEDYNSIVKNKRLKNGLVWPIPMSLQVPKAVYEEIKNEKKIALKDGQGDICAIVEVSEIFKPDQKKECELVYKTIETAHPGVQYTLDAGEYYVAGKVKLLKHLYDEFPEYNLGCEGTRAAFIKNGWKKIVAFQTRNPVHNAHEYLLRVALETVDGLMIHPTMGETKDDDIPANVRMECYKETLRHFPDGRTLLCVMPASMRYAGPREAVLHAIVRQNYGCSHFIVGRDHAGVGQYYGTYEAQEIFNEFKPSDFEIQTIFFEHSVYCRACEGMSSLKTCPHGKENHIFLSGTKVREMLSNGEIPPKEFTRPEVAKILIESMKEKVTS